MAVDSEAARCVAKVAVDRWRVAIGETVDLLPRQRPIWPEGLPADFRNTPVGIARTAPRWGRARGIREIEALNRDAFMAAQQTIYIEAQYLADSLLRDTLCATLARERGPEIVILVTRAAHGFLERWIMGGNRNRVIRKLRREDRFGRFRVYYPVHARPEGDCEIFIHSKLLIVDDRFLRIGSSNFNRRSMGLDTECDLAIEATNPETCAAIARIRDALLAEHLGVQPPAVGREIAATGGIIKAIERLSTSSRTLREYTEIPERGSTHLMPGTRILDPRKPIPLLSLFRRRRSAAHF
jgi:phosphatidylserine/phosphatidylglycerophosphate/cardiolipin synthase-like enzyme